MMKTEVEKMNCEKMEALKMNEELKKEVEGFKIEVEMYREKMWTTERNLSEVEKLVQDNEDDHRRELQAERQRGRELEDRIQRLEAAKAAAPCDIDALKVRELELREKEFELAKMKYDAHKAVEVDNAAAFTSCLSISDPSGDVLCDFSMLRSLEPSLKSEKTSVSTVAGLLDLALLKSPELVLILESVGQFSVKFVLQRFKNKFKSLWKVSEASMSLISVLLMGRFNAEKTRAAIKYAGSRSMRSLQRDISVVNKSGSVPVLEMKFKEMVLTDMPGYAELLVTVDKAVVEEHWKALEDFVVGSVCFIKDVKKKLEEATADLEKFCGKDMEDAGDMLAAYNSLFDVCTSWLGTAIEGEFQKIQRF